MTSIWMALAPETQSTRVLATYADRTLLKARLASTPSSPRALQSLLEAIALWQGDPVRAAFVVDATSTRIDPAAWLGGFPPRERSALYAIDPVSRVRLRVRDELGEMGDFDDLAALLASEALR